MLREVATRGWDRPRSCVSEADLPSGRAGLLAAGVGSRCPQREGTDAHTVPSATVVSAAQEDMGPLVALLRVPPRASAQRGMTCLHNGHTRFPMFFFSSSENFKP